MSDMLVKGMVNTMIDGIKDAQMQYDYACAAKKADERELAKLHIDEAERRISGVSAWHRAAEEMLGERQHGDAAFDAMYEHYADWAHSLRAKIGEFEV